MIIMHDCFGFGVRLTVERQAHILQHPEMAGLEEAIADTFMERVDEHGHVLGFSILGISRHAKERPFEAELTAHAM